MITAFPVLSFYFRLVIGRRCSESEGEMKVKGGTFLWGSKKKKNPAEVGVGTDSRLGRGRFFRKPGRLGLCDPGFHFS